MASKNYSNGSMDKDLMPVLVRYGQHAKKTRLPKGAGIFELQESCSEMYPDAESYFLQVHDDEFEEWVDVDDSFTLNQKTIIQMMDEEKEARPTKRKALPPPPPTPPLPPPPPPQPTNARRKRLLNTIKSIKKRKTNNQSTVECSSTKDKPKSSEVTFQMGWLHFNPKQRKYVQVRMMTGGGTLTMRMGREATMEEVIMLACNTFFPNGHSAMGAAKDMIMELSDFRAKPIYDEGWTLNSSASPGAKLRLYLRTTLADQRKIQPTSDTESDLHAPEWEYQAGPSDRLDTRHCNSENDDLSDEIKSDMQVQYVEQHEHLRNSENEDLSAEIQSNMQVEYVETASASELGTSSPPLQGSPP